MRRIKPPRPGPAIAIAFALLCATAPRAQTADSPPAPLAPGDGPASPSAQAAPDPATTRSRQLSPSNRGTALIISEIMYHPRETGGTEVLEYIEIFNTEPVSEIIGGCRLGGDVEFTFPPRMALPGRGFIVVARDPESLRQATGITNVIGPFTGNLPNDAGQVRLLNRAGAVLLEVEYEDQLPWPIAADGAGHSLVLARPDYGEDSVDAWSASAEIGGSPGRADPEAEDPLDAVVVNEFLANSDLPDVDFIELFNRGTQTVDLSGCGLSDRPDTNKFIIPAGTLLPAGRSALFSEAGLGFGLSSQGESIFFVRPDATRVIDAVRFGAQSAGVSSGRSPDGAPAIRELSRPTPGAPNSAPALHDIVIHEIMYHPISGLIEDEYVELHNRGSNAVDVGYWRFVDGISFMIPPDTRVEPGGYLVVARDRARLLAKYPQLNSANTLGNYEGELSDRGERLALAKPNDPLLPFQDFVLVDEVTYSDGWGRWTDGGGSSLELIDARADNALGANWTGSDETAKSPWTDIEHTGVIDNQAGSMEELQVFCQQGGECLLDNIELKKAGETVNRVQNSSFESGLSGWELLGTHERSGIETGAGYASNRGLHVRATSQGRYTISVYRITFDRLSTPITAPGAGETFTIRAKGRWIAGWPYIIIGVKGHALEAVGALDVPDNLGTPGQPNSRRVSNAGPAICDVQHAPVLPAAAQPVTVSARVHDPDGVASVVLKWRNDTAAGPVTTTPMTDPDGDGVYRATFPGLLTGQIASFTIEAADAAAPPATSRFPGPAPTGMPVFECLVRFGDTLPPGVFGAYRIWVSSGNVARWQARPTRSNEPVDTTFTYDDYRTVYNAAVRYRGNWREGGFEDYRLAAYMIEFPKTERVLGDTEIALDFISLNQDNGTKQQEKHAYWMARQVDLASIAMRYVHVSVNGSALFRYDSFSPSRSLCSRWYGDDDPHVYEQLYPHEPFANYTTTGGVKKQAKYRYCMRKKVTTVPDDDFSPLYRVIDALRASTDDLYVARVSALADIRSWAGYWVINRMCGNSDHYNSPGYPHNMYTYIPPYERSRLHVNDTDGAFRTAYSIFPDSGFLPGTMFAKPELRRVYWRLACDVARGPMDPALSTKRLNDWYQAFRDNRLTATSPSEMSAWITARRNEYLQRLAPMTNIAFKVSTPNIATNSTPITVIGEAPIAVTAIEVNGLPHAVKWIGETVWQIRIALDPGSNALAFRALDEQGAVVGNATLTVTYTGSPVSLEGKLLISEIMYHPAAPASSFIEILNLSPTETLPLGGLRVDGIDATIGHGRFIAPGGYAVVAKSLPGYQSSYGNAEAVVAEFNGTLDNGGETLSLQWKDGTNTIVLDQVTYDDDPPWPAAADGAGASLQLIHVFRDNDRIGNWTAIEPGSTLPLATPGQTNNVTAPLPEFPFLWINEVMPSNTSALADNAGEFDPWIELFNAGSNATDLTGCHLSGDPSNLRQWAFPDGSMIGPGERLLVWADAQPGQTDGPHLHAAFRLDSGSGTVVLAWHHLGRTLVLDAISYADLPADCSYGSYPDGAPHARRVFHNPTPALPNSPAWPPLLVTINEWMAGNTRTLADPADGDFDDWFELHNAGPYPAHLGTYTLTDNLDNPTKFSIPAGTIIPPGGFLLLWADEETDQNAPGQGLHVNFRLAQGGEHIGLFDPDGSPVDTVSFDPQSNDISFGRFPDGAELPAYEMVEPTPRSPNSLAGANRPPVFDPLPDQTVAEGSPLVFTVRATDPDAGETVRYSLGPDAPPEAALDEQTGEFRWVPGEADGPSLLRFLVHAADNGTPVRIGNLTVNVNVTEVNEPPRIDPIPDQVVDEGALLTLEFTATDPDLPPHRLIFTLAPGAPEDALLTKDGAFTWIPDESRGDTVVALTVRVSDQGSPEYTDTTSFNVLVREVPNPPVMPSLPTQFVAEGSPFSLRIAAFDPDTPPSPLIFALDAAPPGATISPLTGEIRWLPGEEVGPTNATFFVRAAELQPPHASSTRAYTVTVTEVNQAPALLPIADQALREGDTLAIQAAALDVDLPPQTLTFSFAGGAPADMSIDTATGRILWPVAPDQGASTSDVTVRVTDDGPPPRFAERTFRVVVQPQSHLVINEIMYRPATNATEFIEIVNNSSTATADLDGVELTADALMFAFPHGMTLEPGAFTVVVRDRAAFEALYGAGVPIAGQWTGHLDLTADTARLTRVAPGGQTEILDAVRFSSDAPWPGAANGQGGSLQLIDAQQDNTRVGNWAAVPSLGSIQSRRLIEMTNLWRYEQSGRNLGVAWRNPSYDDSAWPSGRALLYAETAALPAPKNTRLTLGAITFYLRASFLYDGPTAGVRLKINTIIDDAAIVYLNGTELLRIGFNEGDQVAFNTFAGRWVDNAALEGPFLIEQDALQYGTNVVAVEVHQNNANSSDVAWGMDLEVEGTADAATPGRPNSLAHALPPFPPVFFNEALAVNAAGPVDNAGEREPWIELLNDGPLPVSLEGWYLADSFTELTRWPFPAGFQIEGRALRLLWADGEPSQTTPADAHTSFQLVNGGVLALVRIQAGVPMIVDYLRLPTLPVDISYGSMPDGQTRIRDLLASPTPLHRNRHVPPPQLANVPSSPADGLRFEWASIPGVRYHVEAAIALTGQPWVTLAESVAQSESMRYTESSAATMRYYRVMVP
ncbi:MAG TPA: lamin tail domain-containing protein [Verrucomicrobiota bacterium]|nr:lamin tail domain-containing protein [Verrucomicrobiota bacterium]